MKIRVVVPGPPVPCERARTVAMKGKAAGRIMSFTPERTRKYQAHVQLHARAAAASCGYVVRAGSVYVVRIVVWREANRGDLDNYVKSLTDGCKGALWIDDRYVRELHAQMLVDRENPRAELVVEQLAEGEVEATPQRNLFGAA